MIPANGEFPNHQHEAKISFDGQGKVSGMRFWSFALHGYSVSQSTVDLLSTLEHGWWSANREFMVLYYVCADGSVPFVSYSIGRPSRNGMPLTEKY